MNFKHLLSIVFVFVLSFGLCSFALADEKAEIPEGYTPIYTAEDLNNIRNDLDGKFILMNDIDLSVYENWESIGTKDEPFIGLFDGNDYSIKNLKINSEHNTKGTYYFGLFGYLVSNVENSVIKNVSIENAKINVKYTGSDTGKCNVGILAGYENYDSILCCAVSGEIKVENFYSSEVGGIVGRGAWSIFECCSSYADIEVVIDQKATMVSVGGIVGTAKYTGEDECCNFGGVKVGNGETNEKCYVKIGGIEGNGSESMGPRNSYNRGDVSVEFSSPRIYIGGLCGESFIIQESYNFGNISYPEDFNGYAGAVSGNMAMSMLPIEPGNEMENVYYINKNMIPTYESECVPEDFSSSPFNNVCLLTEEEFKKQESFVGFDFDTVWRMEENGYPVLRNQPVFSEEVPEESTTEDTTESTTEPNTETTTEPSTEPVTEPSTEPTTNSTTESTTEPSDDCPIADLWFVKAIKWILNSLWNIVIGLIGLF